jgi:V8-like Glu-specific endopeptidase
LVVGLLGVVAVVLVVVFVVLPGGGHRTTLKATQFAGLSQVGALFDGGSDHGAHFCSASVVSSTPGDVIVTAAHCLSGETKGLVFAPMYHDGQAPFGVWTVRDVYVTQSWQDDQDPHADFAFLTVDSQDRDGRQKTLQSVVGADALVTDRPPPESTLVVGYPAQKGGRPIMCSNQTFVRHGYTAFRCGGFVNGTSGGPWLADFNVQTGRGDLYGVTGGRYQGGCVSSLSYASSFGPDAVALYQRAVTNTPGDVPPAPHESGC